MPTYFPVTEESSDKDSDSSSGGSSSQPRSEIDRLEEDDEVEVVSLYGTYDDQD